MKAAKLLLVLVCAQEAYSCILWQPCDCKVSSWSSWSSCSSLCNGHERRYRHKTRQEKDGGKCHYSLVESRACNTGRCRHGYCRSGTCHCQTGWTGKYCNLDRNECLANPNPCQPGGRCVNTRGSYHCFCNHGYVSSHGGNACVDVNECQMNPFRCHPRGTCVNAKGSYRCACHKGYVSKHGGIACFDVDECLRYRPCQHLCTNTPGSYRCRCHSCYTKVGRKCDLRQCRIGGRCYAFGVKNPSNACQECHSNNPRKWTNNNNLPCSDNNVNTKNDRCVNGVCRGTPFSCLPCETHDGRRCRLKRGYCVIQHNGTRTCYANQRQKPGNPCQPR